MMTPKEQAEHLRQQALKTLLDEREAIDPALPTLGYDGTKMILQSHAADRPKTPTETIL